MFREQNRSSMYSWIGPMNLDKENNAIKIKMRMVMERRLTGIRSAYFCRMRSASALRFSNGCSSLNLERMFAVWMSYCYGNEVCLHGF